MVGVEVGGSVRLELPWRSHVPFGLSGSTPPLHETSGGAHVLCRAGLVLSKAVCGGAGRGCSLAQLPHGLEKIGRATGGHGAQAHARWGSDGLLSTGCILAEFRSK